MNNPDHSYGWLKADWPAPLHIRAGTTLRTGGVSLAGYDSFNLALHVGDNPQHVLHNRQQLRVPGEPAWLEQVHSNLVVDASQCRDTVPRADASYSCEANRPCVVMTADCLPLLVTDRQGSCVAAIHAGWRGLADGIIKVTLDSMPVSNNELMVWLGPAIGPDAYEVGEEVRQVFIQQAGEAQSAFTQTDETHWLMDIYLLARQQLERLGVHDVYGGGLCTYHDSERFYSYRRDKVTGRMASLIWIEN